VVSWLGLRRYRDRSGADAVATSWGCYARPNQLPPPGNWRVWLLLAGRGFGKTRTGAETVRANVEMGKKRIALVAPTAADVRDVMVEGESGLLSIWTDAERPRYNPSNRRLTWPNGAIATTYSADEPERLRGQQCDFAWCDEVAAWRYPEAWDMLMFGLRLGDDPRVVVTTTPKPIKIIRDLIADPTTVVTRGSTYDNRANLAPPFLAQIIKNTKARGSAAKNSTQKSSMTSPVRSGTERSSKRLAGQFTKAYPS
jgi:phage terminase large subunit-like protein